MRRPKFDLRRLRDPQLQALRDRAARLRNVQTLRSQITRVRQMPVRAEYLVPGVALLVLALALILSAYSSSNQRTADLLAPTEEAEFLETPLTGTEVVQGGTDLESTASATATTVST